tara:strand:+ start:61 stop:549 length:489 start_codon:yes stop_codon:yes gene_type:complete
MVKNLLSLSFLVFSLISTLYPTKRENTELFQYCYSLEKIISRNSIQKREKVSMKVNSIYKDITKIGVSKSKGVLINRIIYKYKASKDSFIIKFVPNKIYCYAGYWMEKANPGVFEAIFFEKSKKAINEFKELKNEVDELINDINSEYKFIKKDFDSLFNLDK